MGQVLAEQSEERDLQLRLGSSNYGRSCCRPHSTPRTMLHRQRSSSQALCFNSPPPVLQLLLVLVFGLNFVRAGDLRIPATGHAGSSIGAETEVDDTLQLVQWNGYPGCIKDSKEDKLLERWMHCFDQYRGILVQNRMEMTLSDNGISPVDTEGNQFDKEGQEVEALVEHLDTYKGNRSLRRNNLGLHEQNILPSSSSTDLLKKTQSLVRDVGNGGMDGQDMEVTYPFSGVAESTPGNGDVGDVVFSYKGGVASCDTVEEDQARIKSGMGNLPLQEMKQSSAPVDTSRMVESRDTCSLETHSCHEGMRSNGENVTSLSELQAQPDYDTRGAIGIGAVVCGLALICGGRRGRAGRNVKIGPEVSTTRSVAAVDVPGSSSAGESKLSLDSRKISQPLVQKQWFKSSWGRRRLWLAVLTRKSEVLESHRNNSEVSLSAENLSNLLENALKESMTEVMGHDRFEFVEKFRDSFVTTYRTRATVRSEYKKLKKREVGSGGRVKQKSSGNKFSDGGQLKSRLEFLQQILPSDGERFLNGDETDKNSNVDLKTKTLEVKARNRDRGCWDNGESFATAITLLRQDVPIHVGERCHGQSSIGDGLNCDFQSRASTEVSLKEDSSGDEQMYSVDDSCDSEKCVLPEEYSRSLEIPEKEAITDDTDCNYQSDGGYRSSCEEKDIRTVINSRGANHWMFLERSSPVMVDGSVDISADEGSYRSPCGGISRSDLSCNHVQIGSHLEAVDLARSDKSDTESSGNASARDQSLEVDQSYQSLGRTASGDCGSGRSCIRGEGLYRRAVSSRTVLLENQDRMIASPLGRSSPQSPGFTANSDALILAGTNPVEFSAALEKRYDILERSVAAQEKHNLLLAWELKRKSQGLAFKQEHLHLQLESNLLLKENIDLSRMKADFREKELQDRKLTLAYHEFSKTCADQLVAGLVVMLVSLGFSCWTFSYDRLGAVVTTCKPVKDIHRKSSWFGTNWMFNGWSTFSSHWHVLACEVTKGGRMVVGLVIIAFVTSTLLRRSVTSSSHAMPATILMLVLGGFCGFAGKLSIDSLGGSGFTWLVIWECLCTIHAFATCFTPFLYHLLYGHPSVHFFERPSFQSRIHHAIVRFSFHSMLVLILPVLGGVLPFATLEEMMQMMLDWWSPHTLRGRFRTPYYID